MLKYININNIAKKELGISFLEYIACDMTYHLSANPAAPVPGWCNMSRVKMGDELGISKTSAVKLINRLEKKGLIEKNAEGNIRTTLIWYESVVVKKVHRVGEESSPQSVKKVHPIYNKDINSNKKRVQPPTYEDKKPTPLKSNKGLPDGGRAGAAYQSFLKAFGVENNQRLESVAMRINGNEWEAINKHLPGYINRTDPSGKEGKPFRATAIGYLRSMKWLNDPNPKFIDPTQIPTVHKITQIPSR